MTDAYLEGKRAYAEGKPKSSCPYPDISANATLWRAGWRDGQKSDERVAA